MCAPISSSIFSDNFYDPTHREFSPNFVALFIDLAYFFPKVLAPFSSLF